MRREKQIEINLGKACNNRCVFCANGAIEPGDRSFLGFQEVLGEVRQAASEGYRALGFLGGEPTLFPKITEMIRKSRDLGFTRIALCTNGRLLSDDAFLKKLVNSGVTRITLSLHDHRPFVEDRLNGKPGAFNDKLAALNNIVKLMDAGPFLPDGFALNTCLHGGNITCLPEFAAFFQNRGVKEIRFNLLRAEYKAIGSRKLTPPLGWVAKGLEELCSWNESLGNMALSISDVPFCGLPNSFFRNKQLLEKYMGEKRDLDTSVRMCKSRGKRRETFRWKDRRIEKLKTKPSFCKDCTLDVHCEGIWKTYIDIHGEEDLLRGKNELDSTALEPSVSKPTNAPDHLIRLTADCNQSCLFCNNNESAPGYALNLESAAAMIDQLKQESPGRVWMTGGEPTMVPWLAEVVRKASKQGFSPCIQTNAVLFSSTGLGADLKNAGLSEALVSLHAHKPELSDALTCAPNTFHLSIAGIHNLIEAGVNVQINTVICRENFEALADLAEFLQAEFGGKISEWVLSFMAPVAMGKRNAHLLARYKDVTPHLANAIRIAGSHDLLATIPGVCGAPVCVLGEAAAHSVEARGGPPQGGMEERCHLETCQGCANRAYCSGIWKEYLNRFGSDEFTPLRKRILIDPMELAIKLGKQTRSPIE